MGEIVKQVMSANADYADNFGKKGDLIGRPSRQFAILTCMDARLDPAKFAGLAEGDAHVIRNAGGRASDDAIRSLVVSYKLLGTREWFVIHHTGCGMASIAERTMGDLLASSLDEATNSESGWIDNGKNGGTAEGKYHDWLVIGEPIQALVDDVRRIRDSKMVPNSIPIYGFMFDCKSGKLRQIAEASAVGEPC